MESTQEPLKIVCFWFIKGLGMGAANKVPGVSGGVVAFVAGFYEEFIFSLQRMSIKQLLNFFSTDDSKAFINILMASF